MNDKSIMKRTIFLLSMIILFGSCSSEPKYYSESLKEKDLKGKVKTISVNTDVLEEDLVTLFLFIDDASVSFAFDQDGKLIEEKNYDGKGNVSTVTSYIYDEQSRLMEESTVKPQSGNDFESRHTWYTYEDDMLKEKYWGERTEYTRPEYFSITYEYEKGKLKSEIEQRRVTQGDMTTLYYYPDDYTTIEFSVHPAVENPFVGHIDIDWESVPKARIKQIKTSDKSGRVVSYKMEYSDEISTKEPEISLIQFAYNKKGDCIESIGGYMDSFRDYHFSNDNTYLYEYKYDKAGNWVKRTVKKDGNAIAETNRKIEYY